MTATRRGEWLLLLGSVVLSLAAAECAVRVLAPGSAPSGYAPIRMGGPNGGPFNSAGHRDRERSRDKPPGVWRVVSLGDSFAWGWGVLLDDTYPQRVERMLSHRRLQRERWEVVSLAGPGLNSVQEAARLSSEGFAYCPDVVVLGYVLNDSEDANAPEVRRAADWLQPSAGPAWWQPWQRSAAYRLVAGRVHATWENRRRIEDRRATYARDYPGWVEGRRALGSMAAMCHARGVPLLVLIFPDFGGPLDERYPFAALHREVAAVAKAAGAQVLDLLPFYRRLNWELLTVDGTRDAHPNEIAHRVAALALFDALRELLPAPGEREPRSCAAPAAQGGAHPD